MSTVEPPDGPDVTPEPSPADGNFTVGGGPELPRRHLSRTQLIVAGLVVLAIIGGEVALAVSRSSTPKTSSPPIVTLPTTSTAPPVSIVIPPPTTTSVATTTTKPSHTTSTTTTTTVAPTPCNGSDVTVTADATSSSPGESITTTLTDEVACIYFPAYTGTRCYATVGADSAGQQVWPAQNQPVDCSQSNSELTSKTLEPGSVEMVTATWPNPPPGSYTATGVWGLGN